MSDPLSAGREALEQHAWSESAAAFREAERGGRLEPDDLVRLAAAAWWSGDLDEATGALERAYASYVDGQRGTDAAVVAVRLAELAVRRLNFAVGAGWMARAERLLEGTPESVGHAWLLFMQATVALLQRGEVDVALERVERSLELARRHGAVEVEALALSIQGRALLHQGRWPEGMAALDEATAAASSGRLDPRDACSVYCLTLSACSDLRDYRRGGQWAAEADRWMKRLELHGYHGACRVHRAELHRLHGAWDDAEREARSACDELERYRMLDVVGFAHNEVGEVRLRMGDLAGAEAAFERAYEYGWVPQPGLALLLLAQGELEQARRSIERAVAADPGGPEPAPNPLRRAHLLPAQVEIALAAGDLGAARAAADELETVARNHASEALVAAAAAARGAVELHEGALEAAIATLERARKAWQHLDLPYEAARTRVLLGRARAAAGDEAEARLEFRSARATFERLGAVRDLTQLAGWLDEGAAAGAGGVTRTFLFTDIVTSTDLVRLMGDAAWRELIAWHDRLLREAFRAHRGEEVRHTGDGFFVAFERASDAVRCAVAVQRALAAHRHAHGFAPSVRIGLHTAEALRHGGDYAGHGVHVAARVAAEAEGGAILVSGATVAAAGPLDLLLSEPRSVALKGVEGPVEVRTIAWA